MPDQFRWCGRIQKLNRLSCSQAAPVSTICLLVRSEQAILFPGCSRLHHLPPCEVMFVVVCSDHASEEVGIARYHNVSGQCDVIKDNQHWASCCIYIPLHPIVSVLLGRIRLLHPIVSVLLRRFHFFVCYIPRLQYFLGESISMFSFYVSSEGVLGVNK